MSALSSNVIGQPLDRTDGPLKVTGAGALRGRVPAARALPRGHGRASTIPRGQHHALDTTRAERAPGVLLVLTHRNAPKLPEHGRAAVKPPAGRAMSLLQDDDVHYNGEPIAVVVADTLRARARRGAALVDARYAAQARGARLRAGAQGTRTSRRRRRDGEPDVGWGDMDAGQRAAEVKRRRDLHDADGDTTTRWSRTRPSRIGKATT